MRNNPPATECLEYFCLPTCRAAGTVLCDYMPVFTRPWPSQLGAQINMEKRPRLESIMLLVMVSNDCDILCMICNWVKKKIYFFIVQYFFHGDSQVLVIFLSNTVNKQTKNLLFFYFHILPFLFTSEISS